MIVSTCGNWFRQHNPGCVNSVPYILQITPTSNLFDENRGEPLSTQLLVDTQEVDFRAFEIVLTDFQGNRNTGDKGNQFLRGRYTDTNVPGLKPPRRFEGPVDERGRVVEAEHCIVVFNVVVCEKLVDLVDLFLVIQVHSIPFKPVNQFGPLFRDVLEFLFSNWTIWSLGFRFIFNSIAVKPCNPSPSRLRSISYQI